MLVKKTPAGYLIGMIFTAIMGVSASGSMLSYYMTSNYEDFAIYAVITSICFTLSVILYIKARRIEKENKND